MRVSALLFGILLTAASGYVAQVAVQSAGLERAGRPSREAADPPPSPPRARAPIWYGGMLQPITVAVSRDTTPTPTVAGPELFGASPRCTRTTHLAHRATAME